MKTGSILNRFLPIAIVVVLVGCKEPKQNIIAVDEKKPNIIYILADDLGYGDVEVFNTESKIPTPNLNQLAATGKSFTNAHAPAAVCTPTRYSFLTGKYPWRSGRKKGVSWVWGKPLIQENEFTIGKMLQEQGYATACIGKWHLGWNWPTIDGAPATLENQGKNIDYSKPITGGPTALGFDYYYGDDVPGFPPHAFITNDRYVKEPSNWYNVQPFLAGASEDNWKYEELLGRTTENSIEYIKEHANGEKPFFLFLSLTAPHTPIAPSDAFLGKTKAGRYGDFVYEVDYNIGKVLKTLDSLGISDDTMVVFTSDNGSTTQDGTYYHGEFGSMMKNYKHDGSGGLRGAKADTYEGGHRVPFIVKYPNKIKANEKSSALLSQTDMMRTFAELSGYELSDEHGRDSFNVLPLFYNNGTKEVRDAVVTQSSRGALSIQQGDWKLILCSGSSGHWTKPFGELPYMENGKLKNVQLYNLKDDLEETNNLSDENQEKAIAIAKVLAGYIAKGSSRSINLKNKEKIDLWKEVEWVRAITSNQE